MIAAPRRRKRSGMSLIEVLVALTIFLMAWVAVAQLVMISSDNGRDAQWQNRANRLAESKLAEVVAGVTPINSGGSGTLDDYGAPEWQYSINSEPDTAPNLYRVTVRVYRDKPNGDTVEATLVQLVFDPAQRGAAGSSGSASGSGGAGGAGGMGGTGTGGSGSGTPSQ